MAIGGVQISAETIGALLFAIGGLLTAFAIFIRANAKKIEANAKIIAANASEIESRATVVKASADAELAERTFIMDAHKRQITINDQLAERLTQEKALYEKRLADKEKQDESNYRVLQQTQDRIGQEIQGVMRQRFDLIETKIDAIPGKLQDGNKEWLQTIIGELVTQMAERFAEFTLAQEWYPFPDLNDPEWREEFVKPLVNKVRLYRRPVLSDSSVTDAAIVSTGETMEIIQGRKKGWLVVRLPRGNKALYGWLPDHEVTTGLNAMKLATGEHHTAPNPTPIPAT